MTRTTYALTKINIYKLKYIRGPLSDTQPDHINNKRKLVLRRAKMAPDPKKGSLVTILSIDGGGIRGIIPAKILAFLESKLQV